MFKLSPQQPQARYLGLGQEPGQPRALQANGIAHATRAAISEEERQRAAFAAMEERARERQREQALAEQRQAEKEARHRAMLVEEATNTTGCTDQAAREVLEAQGWNIDAAVRILSIQEEQRIRKMQAMAAARAAEEAQLEEQRRLQAAAAVVQRNIRIGHEYVCTRHFRPLPTVQSAIRLIQGERVRVEWTDGSPQGWAFGTVVDRPEETGYFPCEVLCEREPPHRRQVGERCSVKEEFRPIENMGGYLHIRPGESVEVLHMEPSCVWAYVQLDLPAGKGTMEHQGWVPETSLGDLVPQAPVVAG